MREIKVDLISLVGIGLRSQRRVDRVGRSSFGHAREDRPAAAAAAQRRG